jgi:membrane protein YqaA with SNARE-associated domain
MGVMLGLAALWGLAEATVFFIVPDVLLSWIVLRYGARRAVGAAIVACGGALAGGAIMYVWGAEDGEAARAFVDLIPAISSGMIADAGEDLQRKGVAAVFEGMVTGTPYKAYAVEAGIQTIGVLSFLAMSVPARLSRFLAVIAITSVASAILRRRISASATTVAVIGLWIVFYAVYFTIMPN